MQNQPEETGGRPQDSRYPIYFRALICFAASGTLLSSVNWSAQLSKGALLQLAMAALLLAYIPVAHHIARRSIPENSAKIRRWLAFTDALLIGMAMAMANFSLLPSLLFITMVQFNALTQGGGRSWFEHNTAMLIGMGAGYLLHRPTLVVNADLNISAASLIGVFTYFCCYAFYTHKQIARLKADNLQLHKEQRTANLASYKLSRYLPKRLWRAVTTGKEKEIVTERKLLTVFFSDIKDFSQLTEEMEAETLTRLLNSYLTEMSRIVAHYGGTIDKFIGDAVMVVFGDDQSKGPKSDALRCVAMALAMRKRVREMMQEWYDQGISHPLQIRMGINTGYCTVGVFGTADHQTYTVMGTHVNLAARLESAADPGEVLISHETWAMIKQTVMCRDKGHVTVKGFSTPVKVYSVTDLRKNLGGQQSYLEEHAPGFAMHLDLDKVRNYDKEKVLQALQKAQARLKSKVII
ncbi:adenylate/guanylate cyclase domain-containing protein [Microbulbifer salipaludis]|uniref:Adenylate/guanylate cyclase domain-containing protein n=1 Tax=Microbulbifer salipaludis TaxID=187980 RepID=A0ABS3E6K3_9GAMM|nr:adenylate/guanylate cyclase domain-containing protein [Microbulbifer salipaludis]MBN8430941.1 adenylate/guanylate cyclase domain-containing protein [Microbulbifer salipaludis]